MTTHKLYIDGPTTGNGATQLLSPDYYLKNNSILMKATQLWLMLNWKYSNVSHHILLINHLIPRGY